MTATDQLATDDLQDLAHRHLLMHFTRNGAYGPEGKPLLVLDRGEGVYVFDTDGKRYFDGLSSLFCSQLGYSFGEEMASVASQQLSSLAFNTNWATAHPPSIRLAEAMAERAPGDLNRVFFTNGGSEAVEAAWKLVRQYYVARGEQQRTKAIARSIAYHGVTLGALSFTGVKTMKEPFGQAPIPVVRISNTNDFRGERPDLLDELRTTIVARGPGDDRDDHRRARAERRRRARPARGLLGRPSRAGRQVRHRARRRRGHHRLRRFGEWFAAPRYGATPDLITCAKGITSAYAPMGAVIVSDKIAAPLYEDKRMLLHGITYGGHPVAAAIALRNIEIFEREGVLENVRALEGYLGDRLRELKDRIPIVGDVRGEGFFWALELVRDERGDALRRRRARGAAARLPHRAAARGGPDRPPRRPRRRRPAPLAAAGLHGEELDEMVAKTEAVLADASERFFAARDARRARLVAGGGRRGRACGAAARDERADVVVDRRRLRRAVDRLAAARARRDASPCWRRASAATGRAGATAASARRCGPTCPTSSTASAASGRWRPRAPRRTASRRSAPGARSRAWTRGSAGAASCSRPARRRRTRCSTGSRRPRGNGGPARAGRPRDGERAARPARRAPRLRARCGSPRSAAPCTRPATRPCTRRGSRSACATA